MPAFVVGTAGEAGWLFRPPDVEAFVLQHDDLVRCEATVAGCASAAAAATSSKRATSKAAFAGVAAAIAGAFVAGVVVGARAR